MDIDTFERQKTFTYDLARFDGLPEFIDEIHAKHMKLITIVVHCGSVCMYSYSCSYLHSFVTKNVPIHTCSCTYTHTHTWRVVVNKRMLICLLRH